jgi:hypothetical protein
LQPPGGERMTTVKEFIEYLQTLPPDTIVRTVEGYDCGYAYCTEEVDLNLGDKGNVDFIDFTENQFVDKKNYLYKKKLLTIGVK